MRIYVNRPVRFTDAGGNAPLIPPGFAPVVLPIAQTTVIPCIQLAALQWLWSVEDVLAETAVGLPAAAAVRGLSGHKSPAVLDAELPPSAASSLSAWSWSRTRSDYRPTYFYTLSSANTTAIRRFSSVLRSS